MATDEKPGIRVTVEDLSVPGHSESVTLQPGKAGQYVVTCATPMYLAHTQEYPGSGTVILTLKTRRPGEV